MFLTKEALIFLSGYTILQNPKDVSRAGNIHLNSTWVRHWQSNRSICNTYIYRIISYSPLIPVSYTHLDVYKRQCYMCNIQEFYVTNNKTSLGNMDALILQVKTFSLSERIQWCRITEPKIVSSLLMCFYSLRYFHPTKTIVKFISSINVAGYLQSN